MDHMRRGLTATSIIAGTLLAGCSGGESAGRGGPTFHKDVAPILQESCVSCHAPGKVAPFALTAYADAKAVSGAIVAETVARRMPPWGAFETDECRPPAAIRGDMHLRLEEIATLEAWDAAGAPEGDPADAPPGEEPPPEGLAGFDREVQPEEPFTASGAKDQLRCFVIDPDFTETMFVNAYKVVPGNPEVVHHALVFIDPQRQSEGKMDEHGGYDCFGGPGVQGATLLGGWAPGMTAAEYRPDMGAPIPAHALLVMQIHYHATGAAAAPDLTRIQLRFSEGKPAYRLDFGLLGNESGPRPGGDGLLPGPGDERGVTFRIPADAPGHVERIRYTIPSIPSPFRVLGLAPHMHYLGTDMKVVISHAEPGSGPAEECLLQVPQWDFNWQRLYLYDTPLEALPELRSGDVLDLRCTYDNTMGNPFLARALGEQHLAAPIDVTLGEGTLDEMCLAGLPLVRQNL